MKKFLFFVFAITIQPALALAQDPDDVFLNDGYAYASVFTGNFSLFLSILIGVVAVVIVFRSAKRLGGGLFGSVLNYVGIGVSFIVLGTLSTVVDPWYVGLGFNIASTACFALGYVFIVIGANKLFKGIMSN